MGRTETLADGTVLTDWTDTPAIELPDLDLEELANAPPPRRGRPPKSPEQNRWARLEGAGLR